MDTLTQIAILALGGAGAIWLAGAPAWWRTVSRVDKVRWVGTAMLLAMLLYQPQENMRDKGAEHGSEKQRPARVGQNLHGGLREMDWSDGGLIV